jgi:hypothetical protein
MTIHARHNIIILWSCSNVCVCVCVVRAIDIHDWHKHEKVRMHGRDGTKRYQHHIYRTRVVSLLRFVFFLLQCHVRTCTWHVPYHINSRAASSSSRSCDEKKRLPDNIVDDLQSPNDIYIYICVCVYRSISIYIYIDISRTDLRRYTHSSNSISSRNHRCHWT